MPKPLRRRDHDEAERHWLLWLLAGGGAHVKFEQAIVGLPVALRGKRHARLPYSAWDLLEHMRIAQADIAEFCVNPNYQAREWPAAYWPSHGTKKGSDPGE